jgi:hypothetical protein
MNLQVNKEERAREEFVDDYSFMRHPPGHRLSESACERAHEMGVSFLSETEMERCVPLCGKDAHEMGVSFLSETEME